jgi:hypothetical protein
MKTDPYRELEPLLRNAGKDLATQLESLFAGCPALCGFVVRVDDGRLIFTDVETSPQLGAERCDALLELIAAAFSELLDERPEAAELLRGRTFARSVH